MDINEPSVEDRSRIFGELLTKVIIASALDPKILTTTDPTDQAVMEKGEEVCGILSAAAKQHSRIIPNMVWETWKALMLQNRVGAHALALYLDGKNDEVFYGRTKTQ